MPKRHLATRTAALTLPKRTLPMRTLPMRTLPMRILPKRTLPMRTLPMRTLPMRTLPILLLLLLAAAPSPATPGHAPFLAELALAEASSLRAVAAGDLDGDGDLDLVYSVPDAGAVRWLEQPDAAGPWTERAVNDPASDPLAGAHPVAIADLDGDGDLDLVTGARTAGTVDAWLNADGLGTAWTRQTVAPDAPGVRALAVADLDLDGRLDLLAAVTGADDLRWWRQTAAGGWAGRVIDGASGGARHLCLADVDGDGDADLVASSPDTHTVAWWANPRLPAAGSWAETSIATLTSPGALACGDLTRDGVPDILVASGASTLSLVVQTSPGTWIASPVGAGDEVGAISAVALADLDRDGALDPIAAGGDPGGLVWFVFDSDAGAYVARSTDPDPPSSRVVPSFLAADLDGDGDVDLVGLEAVPSAEDAVVLERQRDLSRTPAFRLEDAATVAAAPAFGEAVRHDVDGDGDRDLVYLEEQGGGGAFTLVWSENPGAPDDGAPEPPTLTRHTVADAGGVPEVFVASGLVLGDFDNDGDQDIVVGESDSAARCFDFCENLDGVGTAWDCQLRVPSGTLSTRDIVGPLTAGDFDGDGDLDLAATTGTFDDSGPDGFHWFENLGDMTQTEAFAEHLISTDQPTPQLAARDLDGDGDLDLLALRGGDLMGFENQGFQNQALSWTEAFALDAVDAIEAFETADWDGDGDLDIVTREAATLGLYLRSGASYSRLGLFQSQLDTVAVSALGGLELADFDQDGDLDVLTSFETFGDGAEPGGLLVRLNRWSEHGGGLAGGPIGEGPNPRPGEGAMLETTIVVPVPTLATHVAALDLDGDGRPEAMYHVIGSSDEAVPNVAGNLSATLADLSPADAAEGEEIALLQLRPRHLGRAGDQDLEVDGFELAFSDDGGALGQAAVDALLGEVTLRVADGAEGGSYGQLAARWSSAAVTVAGVAAFELDAADGPTTPPQIAAGDPAAPLLTVGLIVGDDAAAAIAGALRVSLIADGLDASAALSDTPALLVPFAGLEVEVVLASADDVLFSDDFESGDVDAWTASSP